jgi:hypothetical protein
MVSGSPIVSNSRELNVEWLLTDKVARRTPPSAEALPNAVLALAQDDALRARQVNAGLEFAQGADRRSELRSIEPALYCGLGVSSEAADE